MKDATAPAPLTAPVRPELAELHKRLQEAHPDWVVTLTSESLQIILPGEHKASVVILKDCAEVPGMLSHEQATFIPQILTLTEHKVILTRVHVAWPLLEVLQANDVTMSHVNSGPWMHLTLPGGLPPVRIGGRSMPRQWLDPQVVAELRERAKALATPEACDEELDALAPVRAHLRAFFHMMRVDEPAGVPSISRALAHWHFNEAWLQMRRVRITPADGARWSSQLESVTDSGPESVLNGWIKEALAPEPTRPIQTGAAPQVTHGNLNDLDLGDLGFDVPTPRGQRRQTTPEARSEPRTAPQIVSVRGLGDLKL